MESPVNVAVNCDLTLIVGQAKEQIRVKSAYLTEASKPFAAMLSRTWKAPDVDTVELPDDDPEAMLEICYALHRKYDQLQTPPSPETILEIAIIADKYFLYDALTDVAAAFWLIHDNEGFQYTIAREGFLGLMQLTAAARLLRAPAPFGEYTRELVCHWGGSYDIDEPGCEDLFMDKRLSKSLELQRQILQRGAISLFTHRLWIGPRLKLNIKFLEKHFYTRAQALVDSEIHPTTLEHIVNAVKKAMATPKFCRDWEGYKPKRDNRDGWERRGLQTMIRRSGLCLFCYNLRVLNTHKCPFQHGPPPSDDWKWEFRESPPQLPDGCHPDDPDVHYQRSEWTWKGNLDDYLEFGLRSDCILEFGPAWS